MLRPNVGLFLAFTCCSPNRRHVGLHSARRAHRANEVVLNRVRDANSADCIGSKRREPDPSGQLEANENSKAVKGGRPSGSRIKHRYSILRADFLGLRRSAKKLGPSRSGARV